MPTRRQISLLLKPPEIYWEKAQGFWQKNWENWGGGGENTPNKYFLELDVFPLTALLFLFPGRAMNSIGDSYQTAFPFISTCMTAIVLSISWEFLFSSPNKEMLMVWSRAENGIEIVWLARLPLLIGHRNPKLLRNNGEYTGERGW